MLRTDFCNRPTTRAPVGSHDSRGDRLLSPALASDGTKAPLDDSGHDALDGASRASDDARTACRSGRTRAPADPGELPIGRALSQAPLRSRCSLPRARSARRPLTPLVATRAAPKRSHAAETAFACASSKVTGSERSRASSIDECPLGPTLARETSNADPPPVPGLGRPDPASDALSPARLP